VGESGSGFGPVEARVNTVMNLREPLNVVKSLSSCTTDVFSRRTPFHEVGLF
jgi:hypothetical protein